MLEREFSLPTTSWWMAENAESRVFPCSVELEGEVTERVAEEAEERCNEAIRRAEGVTVKMCQLGDPELDEVQHKQSFP